MDQTLLAKLDLTVRYHTSIGQHYMAAYLQNQYNLLKNITEKQKQYIAATYYIPGELLACFDAEAVFLERFAGLAAAWRLLDHPVARADATCFPADGCSYQALFHLLLTEKIIPKPEAFAAMNFSCRNAWRYCKSETQRHYLPFFHVDVPRILSQRQIHILADELQTLYNRLCKMFPVKAEIQDVVQASNEALAVQQKINAFRRAHPEKCSTIDFLKLFPLYNDLGKPDTPDILQGFLKRLTEADTSDTGNIPRVLWLGIVPLYRNSLLTQIEKQGNCRIVWEEMFDFGNIKLSCDSFFTDLAKRILTSRFFTQENRLTDIAQSIKDFGAQGIIHFSQRNCRFLPSAVPLIRQKAQELQIPFLELRGDAVDPGYFDEQAAAMQLEQFYEQLHRSASCI